MIQVHHIHLNILLQLIIIIGYSIIFCTFVLNQHEKKNSVDAQFNMLKQQMKPHEKLYTVTVKTKQGKRVVVVPKNNMTKLKKENTLKLKMVLFSNLYEPM